MLTVALTLCLMVTLASIAWAGSVYVIREGRLLWRYCRRSRYRAAGDARHTSRAAKATTSL